MSRVEKQDEEKSPGLCNKKIKLVRRDELMLFFFILELSVVKTFLRLTREIFVENIHLKTSCFLQRQKI